MRTFIALLFLISAISAQTSETYRKIIGPAAEACKRKLGASDNEMNAVMHLRKDLYNEKAKCMSECILERIGAMKNGSWTAVPGERRLAVYNQVFAGDSRRLKVANRIINVCQVQADENNRAARKGCQSAYDGIACIWDLTY